MEVELKCAMTIPTTQCVASDGQTMMPQLFADIEDTVTHPTVRIGIN